MDKTLGKVHLIKTLKDAKRQFGQCLEVNGNVPLAKQHINIIAPNVTCLSLQHEPINK